MKLPSEVHAAAAIRQFEREAIESGIAGYSLMQAAGKAALRILQQRWPAARRIAVIAGPGNNGGDGLVLARLARAVGIQVRVFLVGDAGAIGGEAAQALAELRKAGIATEPFDASGLRDFDLLVDALLGLGVRAPLQPAWQSAIEAMNRSGLPILSLDLPSGLQPDDGRALPAVRATATITFLGLKQGLFLNDGPEHAGELHFDSLGIAPRAAAGQSTPEACFQLLDENCIAAALAPRARNGHKGRYGRVLIVGGDHGMAGAVRMAGESALRVGAGLVTVASRPEHLAVVGERPELMFRAVARAADLEVAMRGADVIAIGPGLGQSEWSRELLQWVLHSVQPGQRLVLDADALNLVAASALQRDDWILTPHPGEAARLLGVDAQAVQADRLASLRELVRTRGGIVVLKGAGTLVGGNAHLPRLCRRGNPGMAVPGMGDVLTGAIAGLLAQSGDAHAATCAAVQVHAMAGDLCAAKGLRGMLALEVADALRAVLAPLP